MDTEMLRPSAAQPPALTPEMATFLLYVLTADPALSPKIPVAVMPQMQDCLQALAAIARGAQPVS
jgi:hypothetical protein